MTLQYQSSDPAQKPALRRLFKQQRQGLSAYLRDEHHQNIMQHLNRLLAKQVDAHHIAVYLATHDEADLQPWIESAWSNAKRLYAPVVGKTEGQMAFYPLTEATPLRQVALLEHPHVPFAKDCGGITLARRCSRL